MLCPCAVFSVGCSGDLIAGGGIIAARRRLRQRRPSASTVVATVTMDGSLEWSAEAMLEDTEDLHVASAGAAHLEALRHWRKRTHGSRVQRRRRYVGSVPGHRPNKRRTFRSGLRAI